MSVRFGAWVGLAAGTTVLLAWAGVGFRSGRGALVDGVTAAVLGWLVIGAVAVLLLLAGWILRRIPVRLLAVATAATVVVGAVGFWTTAWYAPLLAALVLAAAAIAGAGTTALLRTAGQRRPAALAATAAGLVTVVAATAWLAAGGPQADPGDPPPAGPFDVRTFTYGGGAPADRPEFGADALVRTDPVDITPMMDGWRGWLGGRRSAYWGFGPEAVPLNATVWAPEAEGPFPLVLVVHGNAPMELPSDTGYAWLARDLASRGYVVASVDQNFLNISYTRGWDLRADNDARAWLLLEHLRLWRAWEAEPGHPLHGLADLGSIALIGHSRGGEAVVTAAAFDGMARYPEDARVAFDAGFGIDAVVAIAPIEGAYYPAGRPTVLEDTSYLVLHGGLDGDVFWSAGLRQLQRVVFSGDRFAATASVWLPDANHGQFNTVWGRQDLGGLPGAVLDTELIMPAVDQRAVAGAAIAAFLDGTLRGERDGLGAFTDRGAALWSKAPGVITRYADSAATTIADFSEDPDPSTGTLPGTHLAGTRLAVWREEPVPLRDGGTRGSAVVLGWDRAIGAEPPALSLTLPSGWSPPRDPVLVVTLSDSGEHTPASSAVGDRPVDLTVEAVDAEGRTLGASIADLGGVPLAPRSRRFKSPLPEWAGDIEPIAQTFRIPLAGAPGFDPARLRSVRLVFDGTPTGSILLEDVSITSAVLP